MLDQVGLEGMILVNCIREIVNCIEGPNGKPSWWRLYILKSL